jgi:hypothetical protein
MSASWATLSECATAQSRLWDLGLGFVIGVGGTIAVSLAFITAAVIAANRDYPEEPFYSGSDR